MAAGPGLARTLVWLVDLDAASEALEAVAAGLAMISDAERAAFDAGPDRTGGRRRLAAHRALRIAIAHHFGRRWVGAPIVPAARGKPGIAGLRGDFSLSHSGGWALLATTDRTAIGVDLELPRTVRLSPSRTAAMIAAARLASSDPEAIAGILDAWVRLEAVAKATGQGIGATLTALGLRTRASLPIAPPPDWPRACGIDLAGFAIGDRGPFTAAAAFEGHRAGAQIAVRALPLEREALTALLDWAAFAAAGVDATRDRKTQPTTDYRLPTTDYRLPTTDYRLPPADGHCPSCRPMPFAETPFRR